MSKCFKMGHIEVMLKGEKLKGPYALVNFKDPKSWLIVKMKKRNSDERKKTK